MSPLPTEPDRALAEIGVTLTVFPLHSASPAGFEFIWQNEAGCAWPLHFALKLPPEAQFWQDAARQRVRTAAQQGG